MRTSRTVKIPRLLFWLLLVLAVWALSVALKSMFVQVRWRGELPSLAFLAVTAQILDVYLSHVILKADNRKASTESPTDGGEDVQQ